MLRGLSIRDMLLIDRLELEFQPGLNVLTGETGAGKSILLDSLGFALGWRGRAELVREGATQGEVTAAFELPEDHPAHAILDEAGLGDADCDDPTTLLLRRTNALDGRKQAYVNDRRCSGEMLRRISETLLELHGQHDDRGLLNPRSHRDLLDSFGVLDKQLASCRDAWQSLRHARAALEEKQAHLAKVATDRDFLVHAVEEMDTLKPETGEDATLDGARRLMQAAERIREDIGRAAVALGPTGAEGLMADAARWLTDAAGSAEGRLDTPLADLARAQEDLAQAVEGVETCLSALDFDPNTLEQTEERLFAIRALARKHNVLPDALGEFGETLRARLSEIDSGAENLTTLEIAVDEAASHYHEHANALSAARKKAAGRLDKAMMAQLAPLKMERAIFQTECAITSEGPTGRDNVQFTVATNPGAPAGALNKIASGGELSRFLLALKVCLHGTAKGITMIFDEIDRGVGGATADAVGRRLNALASSGQVLVVTHSPQVAAFGQAHWVVSKSVSKNSTKTDVSPVTGPARRDEIARMLAGDTITDEARAAAGVLLKAGH